MRCFITGVAGFIGSHVAQALLDERWDVTGWEVSGIDDLTTGRKENVPDGVNFDVADVRDGIPKDADVVFHAAGFSRAGESFKYPEACYQANVDGTTAVCESLRGSKVRLVYASSAVVLSPLSSPYAASKAAGEALVEAYRETYEFDAACLRYASVYGPGQSQEGDSPNVIAAMLRDRAQRGRVKVSGDGHQTRDFIHIKDATRATVEAIKGSQLRDVATGLQTPILEVAQMFDCPIELVTPRRNDPQELRQKGHLTGCISVRDGIAECLTSSFSP